MGTRLPAWNKDRLLARTEAAVLSSVQPAICSQDVETIRICPAVNTAES